MNEEIRQKLLSLENRDLVQKWFNIIHKRDLNLIRTKEINAAAKQSSEFFRNAENSNFTVRPLFTYYSVASLSRALILLLKPKSGEESLTSGHGLKTISWSNTLTNDLNKSLLALGELKVETCSGLFSNLIIETKNRISIHAQSGGVDWRINYDVPNIGNQFKLIDLLSRIPDLETELTNIDIEPKFDYISQLSYNPEDGFNANIGALRSKNLITTFQNLGYNISKKNDVYKINCPSDLFLKATPLFLHTYVHKLFKSIPQLFIAEPFYHNQNYSEISIAFLMSYYLGMLVRYFPTHWTALIHGEKGDIYWPILNKAQHYVERIFPELVIELIYDILKDNKKSISQNK